MRGQIQRCLLTAAALFGVVGCRAETTPNEEVDLARSAGNSDARMPPLVTTIRDLNSGAVAPDTNVTVQGVVLSPYTWIEVNEKTTCRFHLYAVQPDPAPTLKDGLHVYFSRKPDGANMDVNLDRCKELGQNLEIYTAKAGHTVEITGKFDKSTNNLRQIYVFGGNGVRDMGMAPAQPTPVDIDPGMLASGDSAAFVAAQYAFVRFQNVTSSDRRLDFPFDFKVSSNGTSKATISPNYYRRSGFMPPADGTRFASITGIANPSFGGTIWPRTDRDLVLK